MELSWSGVNRLGAEKEQNLSTCELHTIMYMYVNYSLCTINAFLFLSFCGINFGMTLCGLKFDFVVVYIKCNTCTSKNLFTRLCDLKATCVYTRKQ
jgi:hypothetical protein